MHTGLLESSDVPGIKAILTNVLSCLLDAGRLTVLTTLKFGDNSKDEQVRVWHAAGKELV